MHPAKRTWLKIGGCMQRRLFTHEEANSLVPWLERTFQRLASSMQRLGELREQLEALQRDKRRLNGSFDRYNESNRVQSEMEPLSREIQAGVDEVQAEGIIVRDISSGLIDFPHMRQGREVFLCWISGEESIEYWHETNRGFAHREPL